jgi:hypothetical protein
VAREHVVDQCLVADLAALGFVPQRLEDVWIDADRDQLPGDVSERRPAHTAHRRQLGIAQRRESEQSIAGSRFVRRPLLREHNLVIYRIGE